MKQIVCEMCGSTDLIKQDGVFVCQACGCKYSVEDAKKMMVEVEGAVTVQNAAQLDNLMNLAHSSFDSKNYAKAEDFCNQVIAMDDQSYEAWKLKGEAINYQISATNPRIDEVINCILTSYRVLDDEGKDLHRDEIVKSIRICLEGEVEFWVDQIEKGRPTAATMAKASSSFFDSKLKMITSFAELGITSEEKDEYTSSFDNAFINACSATANRAWKSTVGYNYYRDYFDSLGARWVVKNFHNIDFRTDEYRPGKKIWETFISETDNLVQLLQMAEKVFNDETSEKVIEAIFSNIVFFEERVIESCSYKTDFGCASTWDTERHLGWIKDYGLTEAAKSARRKIVSEYEEKKRTVPQAVRRRKETKAEKERQAAIAQYWEEHADEKQRLDEEQADVRKKINELNEKISAINKKNEPKRDELRKERDKKLLCEEEVSQQEALVYDLENQKNTCGIFKGKLKKELQARIDEQERPKLEKLRKRAEAEKKSHQDRLNAQINELSLEGKDLRDEVFALKKRDAEITEELTKTR